MSLVGLTQDYAEIRITEKLEQQQLTEVLQLLGEKYNLKFAYDNSTLSDQEINLSLTNEKLNNALTKILEGTGLEFTVLQSTIIIKAKASGEIESMSPTRFNFPLNGLIIDKQTGESLPNSIIKIEGVLYGTVSNTDGYFTLLNVPSDTCTIVFSYLGYKTLRLKLDPFSETQNLQIELISAPEMLNEVMILDQAFRTVKSGNEPGQVALNPTQLSSLPSLGELDLLKTLQLLPGISGTNESSAGLFVRGGTPDQNLILFDGFTIYYLDHFFGIFSAFNANAVKDLQLYKTAFPAKYGERVSSVVDITGKSGNMNKPSFGMGLNLLSANFTLEVPIKNKVSFLLAARRSYTDVVQSPLYNSLFDNISGENEKVELPIGGSRRFINKEIDPNFYYFDINGKITYKPSEKDILSFSYYQGRDKLKTNYNVGEILDPDISFGFDYSENDASEWGTEGFSLRWGRQWNKKFYSNINLGKSEYISEFERNRNLRVYLDEESQITNTTFTEENDVKDFMLRWDNEWNFHPNSKLEFGLLFNENDILYKVTSTDFELANLSDKGKQKSIYFQNTSRLFKKLSLSLGLRINDFSLTEQYYFQPRGSLTYNIGKNISLKAGAGKYYQFINRVISESLFSSSRDFWVLTDGENFPVISGNHFLAGFAYETSDFLFDIEAYWKSTDGLLENLRLTEPFFEIPGPTEAFFTGDGVARGIDFFLQKKTGKHTGWIGYSLARVDHNFPQLNNGNDFPALHDQRHELKIVNMYGIKKWDFSLTWVYGSGRPYTSPSAIYDLNLLGGAQKPFLYVGVKNNTRLPDYHRLDFSATYNYNIGKVGKGQVGLALINLYDRDNIKFRQIQGISLGDNSPDGQRLIVADVKLLGFTPNVFLNFKF